MNVTVTQAVSAATGLTVLMGGGWQGYQKYDDLITTEEMHEYVQASTEPLQSDLNQIIGIQIEEQLADFYRSKCAGYQSRSNDRTIAQLEAQYFERMKRRYQPPSCQYLEVTQ